MDEDENQAALERYTKCIFKDEQDDKGNAWNAVWELYEIHNMDLELFEILANIMKDWYKLGESITWDQRLQDPVRTNPTWRPLSEIAISHYSTPHPPEPVIFSQSEHVPLIICYSMTRDRILPPPVRRLGFQSYLRSPAPATAVDIFWLEPSYATRTRSRTAIPPLGEFCSLEVVYVTNRWRPLGDRFVGDQLWVHSPRP